MNIVMAIAATGAVKVMGAIKVTRVNSKIVLIQTSILCPILHIVLVLVTMKNLHQIIIFLAITTIACTH